MSYVKTTWVNGTTKLNATNMNNIENGIESLDQNAVKDASYVHTDNNYTTAEKTKLSGIEAGANNYVLPTANASTKGGVQPVAKTSAMTNAVGVDSDGKLYSIPGGGSGSATWGEIAGTLENQSDLYDKLEKIEHEYGGVTDALNKKIRPQVLQTLSSVNGNNRDYSWIIAENAGKLAYRGRLKSFTNQASLTGWSDSGTIQIAIAKLNSDNSKFTIVSPTYTLPVAAGANEQIITQDIYLNSDEVIAIGPSDSASHVVWQSEVAGKALYFEGNTLPAIGVETDTLSERTGLSTTFLFKVECECGENLDRLFEDVAEAKQITSMIDKDAATTATKTSIAVTGTYGTASVDNRFWFITSRTLNYPAYVTQFIIPEGYGYDEPTEIEVGIIHINSRSPLNYTVKDIIPITVTGTSYVFDKPIFLDNGDVISVKSTTAANLRYQYNNLDSCYGHTLPDPAIGSTANGATSTLGIALTPQFTYTYKTIPNIAEIQSGLDAKIDQSDFQPIESMFRTDNFYYTGSPEITGSYGSGGLNFLSTTATIPHAGILKEVKNIWHRNERQITIDVYDFDIETGVYERTGSSTVTMTGADWIALDTPIEVTAGQYIVCRGQLADIKYKGITGARGTWNFPNADSGTFDVATLTVSSGISMEYKIQETLYYNPKTEMDNKVDKTEYANIERYFKFEHADNQVASPYWGTWNNTDTNKIAWLTTSWRFNHDGYVDRIIIPNATAETVTLQKDLKIAIVTLDSTNMTWARRGNLLTVTVNPGDTYIDLPEQLEVKAGDYLGVQGTMTYVSDSSQTNYVSTIPFHTAASGTYTTSTRAENPRGIDFQVHYVTWRDLDGELEDLQDQIDDINDNLDITNSYSIYNQATYTSGSACSPGNVFWAQKAYSVPEDGYITAVDVKVNTNTGDELCAVGKFSLEQDGSTYTMTLLGKSSLDVLPAGQTVCTFTEPLQVSAGDYIGLAFNGQKWRNQSSGSVTWNGVNIGASVGTSARGAYTGSLTLFPSYTLFTKHSIKEKVLANESNIEILDQRTSSLKYSTSYKDAMKVALVGSSLTEASYCPNTTTWPERVNDAVDINVVNWGWSGHNIKTNLDMITANGSTRFNSAKFRQVNPHYVLWDDCANGSATGETAIQQYRHVKEVVESIGAKLLMGSEENYSNNYNAYEHTQQCFSEEADVPYSPITRIQEWCYSRNTAYTPYPVNGSSHSGYRANAPYINHKDLLGVLPIKKSVKMFKVRTTYKGGSPAIADLAYDTNQQRLRYWTAICPGQCGGCAPGHIDNLDGSANDVPGTTNISNQASETTQMFLGNDVTFNKFGLVEFILDKVNISTGTFSIESSVNPTGVYIAKANNATQTYTDAFIRTTFEEVTDFTYDSSTHKVSFTLTDPNHEYELYDKLRVVIASTGSFTLAKPIFENYDGIDKQLDTSLHYHRRKFGTELNDKTSMETGWTLTGTAAVKSLPSVIANYTRYNEVKSHMQLNADGDKCTKNIALSGGGKYRKVAVRVVAQMWQNIATIRYNGTEYEGNEYIDNDTSATGAAAYINSDYDYGTLKVSVNSNIHKNLTILPGWNEFYFELSLTPDDSTFSVSLTKNSWVDDSYTNDDHPIFIHDFSVQEIN